MLLLLASLALAQDTADSTGWVQPRASVGLQAGAVDTALLHPRLLTGLEAEWHLSEPVSIALSGGWAPELGTAADLAIFWSYPTWSDPDLARLLGQAHTSLRLSPVRGWLHLGQRPMRVQVFAEVGAGAVYSTQTQASSPLFIVLQPPEREVRPSALRGLAPAST